MRQIVLATLTCSILTGCNIEPMLNASKVSAISKRPGLSYTSVLQSVLPTASEFSTPVNAVFSSQAELDAYISTYQNQFLYLKDRLSNVDFSKEQAVLVVGDTYPTGDVSLNIINIEINGQEAIVHSSVLIPAPGGPGNSMPGQPFDYVKFIKTDKSIRFEKPIVLFR